MNNMCAEKKVTEYQQKGFQRNLIAAHVDTRHGIQF